MIVRSPLSVAVAVGLPVIVSTSVAIESQPFALLSSCVYVPEVVYVLPSVHVYSSQAEAVVVEDVALLIVRTSVAIESQPIALVSVCVYVPEAVYVVPSVHVYDSQAVSVVVEVVLLLIVSTSVAIESQP